MSDSGTGARVAWVKLGKVWWPGKVMNEDDFTDEMKADLAARLSRKNSVKPDQIYVVKFFNEDAYEIVFKPNEILLDVNEEKKHDLVKKALSSMKSSTLADNKAKFKTDVLDAERHLNPSADLSNLTKLLDGEILEKKTVGVSKYADIFPTAKPEKQSPITTVTGKGKAGSIKFNFPSSRIISKASSKPPSKISPLPSDPSKKFKCGKCAFSADRVNVITAHMKHCNGNTTQTQQQKKISLAATSLPLPTSNTPTPVLSPKKAAPPVAATATTTPLTSAPAPRKPGRPPRKSVTPVTPIVMSPPKSNTQVIAPTPCSPPKKRRGRRSKKDKQLSEKQKAEILEDWNDSSSEENDSDDDLAPMMPPTKPPELFLFGSEKNKKRKADTVAVDEKVDTIFPNNEAVACASTVVHNEDEPPVLKKPRTDKELSDAFDSLLKTTKMELPTWDEKAGKEQTEEEDEKMEEENEPQLSDIEEDANILMKKNDTFEVKDVAPVLQKESPQSKDILKKSIEKTPEASEPVPISTNGNIGAEKINETSSKKPEEKKETSTKKPEIVTRRSTRSRGGTVIKDINQVENEKQKEQTPISVLTTAEKVKSPKKSTDEAHGKKECSRKAQSAINECKVNAVSTLNADNKIDEKVEENSTKTKPIPSPKKKEEKFDKVEKLESNKADAVPEKNASALTKSEPLENLPAVETKKDTKVVPPPETALETNITDKKKSSQLANATAHPVSIPTSSTVPVSPSSPANTKVASVATVKVPTSSPPPPVVPSIDAPVTTSCPAPKSSPGVNVTSPTYVSKVLPVAALSSPVPKVSPVTAVPIPLSKTTALTTITSISPVPKPVVEITTIQALPPPVVIAAKSTPKLSPPLKKADDNIVTTIQANPPITSGKTPTVGLQPKPPIQPPQKKPTAAVRPLVDTKEVPSPSQKDGKITATTVAGSASARGSYREQPQPQTVAAQTIVTQQQGVAGEESGKKSPTLVAQRVVHLVPVENQDGTITYMLLSLENGNENPNVVLEQGNDQSNTVLRVDKVEPMDQSTSPNIPLNPNEVEGIFLDKNVDNANQIVSALAQGNQGGTQTTATTTTSMMDATTTYVTLAMDAIGDTAASGSDALAAAALMQQSIVIPESATTTQDSSGETQQVFYMTEDGSILDPQSLGLTLEQLQQLLNQ